MEQEKTEEKTKGKWRDKENYTLIGCLLSKEELEEVNYVCYKMGVSKNKLLRIALSHYLLEHWKE